MTVMLDFTVSTPPKGKGGIVNATQWVTNEYFDEDMEERYNRKPWSRVCYSHSTMSDFHPAWPRVSSYKTFPPKANSNNSELDREVISREEIQVWKKAALTIMSEKIYVFFNEIRVDKVFLGFRGINYR